MRLLRGFALYSIISLVILSTLLDEAEGRRKILRGRKTVTRTYYMLISCLLPETKGQQDAKTPSGGDPVGSGNVLRSSSKGFKSSYHHQTIHSGFHSSGSAYSRNNNPTPWWKIFLITLLVVVVLLVIIFLCAIWSRNVSGETSEREAAVTAYLRNHRQQQAA